MNLLGSLDLLPVHLNAPFTLGVEVNGWGRIEDLFVDTEQLRVALDRSSYVTPGVQVYKAAGVINPFIVVEGRSGREYGSATHLKDAVLSVLGQFNVLNRDTVQFQAETYDPQTNAPQTGTYQAAGIDNTPGAYPQLSYPGSGGLVDSIGQAFGLDQTGTYVLIGGGALVTVLLLRRLL